MNDCHAYNCYEPTSEPFCTRCMVAVSEDLRRDMATAKHKYGRGSSEFMSRVFTAKADVARHQRKAQIEIDWFVKRDAARLKQIIRDEVARAKTEFAAKN